MSELGGGLMDLDSWWWRCVFVWRLHVCLQQTVWSEWFDHAILLSYWKLCSETMCVYFTDLQTPKLTNICRLGRLVSGSLLWFWSHLDADSLSSGSKGWSSPFHPSFHPHILQFVPATELSGSLSTGTECSTQHRSGVTEGRRAAELWRERGQQEGGDCRPPWQLCTLMEMNIKWDVVFVCERGGSVCTQPDGTVGNVRQRTKAAAISKSDVNESNDLWITLVVSPESLLL